MKSPSQRSEEYVILSKRCFRRDPVEREKDLVEVNPMFLPFCGINMTDSG